MAEKTVKYQGVVAEPKITLSLIKITENYFGEKIMPPGIDALQLKSGIFSIVLDGTNIWAINRIWEGRGK